MSTRNLIVVLMFCSLAMACGFSGTESGQASRVFAEANRLVSEGRSEEGEEKFNWLIQQNASNPRPYNNLGNLYERKGENEKARVQYEQALELSPSYLIARVNLAVLSLKHGQTEDALRILQQGLKEYPENADLHNGLGICELRKGNLKKAIRNFRKAIDIQGATPVFYNNLAYAYAESNEYLNEALKLAKEASKVEPENPVFRDTIGWVYFKRGVFDQAIEHLQGALEMNQNSAIIRSHLVKVYRWMGRDDQAVALIKDGIRFRVMSGPQ